MSTWQCGVMIMGACGGANSSFTHYLFHMARKSAYAWFLVVSALDVCHMIKVGRRSPASCLRSALLSE